MPETLEQLSNLARAEQVLEMTVRYCSGAWWARIKFADGATASDHASSLSDAILLTLLQPKSQRGRR